MEHSTGEYIAFLDSDDEFMPDKIEKQLAMMAKHNPTISYTSYTRRERDKQIVKCDPGANRHCHTADNKQLYNCNPDSNRS
ncbi:glycosyltransferase [Candidatus Saccharibacteria bacterium]|nr:MAG: glycosyltransferase [Candidatus Saccharibacteria bacterium]